MRKYVRMYAKFTFIVLCAAILIPFSIIFDIVKDIIFVIILLFWNKFDMTVMRDYMAEIIDGKIVNVKNAINNFIELMGDIIED